jgi:hypothetical protein
MVVPIIALVVTTGIKISTRKKDLRRKDFQVSNRARARENRKRTGTTMTRKRNVTERLFQKRGSAKSSRKLSSPVKVPLLWKPFQSKREYHRVAATGQRV